MAETQTPKSGRDKLSERLKAKYPDKEYADDEALFEQINGDYDQYDQDLEGYKNREKELVGLFKRDPRSAQFISDMSRGEDPWLGLIRRIGVDGMTALIQDPAKQEEFAKANQEFAERVAKEEQLQSEYESNLAESLQLLEKIQTERGLSDEQMDAAYDLVNKMAHEAVLGKYSEETVDMALKALNHDQDQAAAAAEGEVRGRNAKIQEQLRKPQQGDGTVQLASGGGGESAPQRKRASIFQTADLAR